MGADDDPIDAADAADDAGEEFDDEEEMTPPGKPPKFTSIPQYFNVRLGDAVRLPCDVDELGPGYTLLWKVICICTCLSTLILLWTIY